MPHVALYHRTKDYRNAVQKWQGTYAMADTSGARPVGAWGVDEPQTNQMADGGPMSETFTVGEVCEYLGADGSTWGECTISGPLGLYAVSDGASRGSNQLGYLFVIPGDPSDAEGGQWFHFPHELRKRKPPRDDLSLVSWDTLPWQPPEKVTT